MKNTITRVMLGLSLIAVSCAKNSDIDELRSELNDINDKVVELEKSQQESLLAEIAKLQALIANLEAQGDDMTGNYEELQNSLNLLEEELMKSGDAVYYGNVITDADFDAVVAQKPSIVTGKVVITKQDHVASLASVKLIGGELNISGGTDVNIPMLESVSGVLNISGLTEASSMVNLPMLKTVGNGLRISSNDGLESVSLPELVLVYGNLNINSNSALITFEAAKLDLIDGNLLIDEFDHDYGEVGMLSNINLSFTAVSYDVLIVGVGANSTVELGEIGGNASFLDNGFTTLNITSSEIRGDFEISRNSTLSELSLDNLTKINGNLIIKSNMQSGFGIGGSSSESKSSSEFKSLEAFNDLEFIGGDVTVRGNEFEAIDSFNKVTTIKGSTILFSGNGGAITLINIFNNLTEVGEYQHSRVNININEKTEWFTGFNALESAETIDLQISFTFDSSTWESGTVSKVDGFESLTSVKILNLGMSEISEFNAFPVLAEFTQTWGVFMNINMPKDSSVSFCSMSDLLNLVKDGEFDNEWNEDTKAVFMDSNTYQEVEREIAVPALLSTCI